MGMDMSRPHFPAQAPCLRQLLICLVLTAGMTATQANTELAGVRYAPTLLSGTSTMVLNGSGISYKALTKQYTVGLYAPAKATDIKTLTGLSGPKQVRLVILVPMRVDNVGQMLARGIEQNSPREEYRRLIPATVQMGAVFAKMRRMRAGDTVAIDYSPAVGTRFLVNGQALGKPIVGEDFFNAVLKTWVGERPISQDLRTQLLNAKAAVALDALDDLDALGE
jgi:Chalcone isomerase-like